MGDMGDLFRDLREQKRGKKAERVEQQRPMIEWLRQRAVTQRILSGGYRFNFPNRAGHHATFDYWPSSGKWARIGRPTFHSKGERNLRAAIERWLEFDPHPGAPK